ncbi:plasmid replication protein RepC (plasmid) [Thioclava sp. 'Guangxiensis']|uniref:plasmid replication protein RepC n=1 Tax=Thioclava sp. 'Guangxiensis' TaxID=3149044 RepID=UPI003877F1EF
MQHISITPFGRGLRASDVTAARMVSHALPEISADKWQLFKQLTAARETYGLKPAALAVLNALLTFHPHRTLAEGDTTIVFPANRSLIERCNGMSESTLRRHLNALVNAGLILRHDSPNGKRYARRSGEQIYMAFGFDLRPLILREGEIADAAAAAHIAQQRRKALHDAISLLLRDASALLHLSPLKQTQTEEINQIWREKRRKLTAAALEELYHVANTIVSALKSLIPNEKSEDLTGNASQNDCHSEIKNKLIKDSDSTEKTEQTIKKRPAPAELDLQNVLNVCSDASDYCETPMQSWQDAIALSHYLAPMMGITQETLHHAQDTMGPEAAASTVLALLQRSSEIRNPGGYLRRLTHQAETFSYNPAGLLRMLQKRQLQAA